MAAKKEPIAYLKQALPGIDPAGLELPADDAPLLAPYADDLLVAYLVDEGDHFTYLQGRDLRELGKTREQIHARGLVNLQLLTGDGRLTMRQVGDATRALFIGGNFEASLILLDSLWDESLRSHYETAPVVAIPARDILAFCDRGSAEGIAELRALVDRVWPSGDHLLTRQLLVRDGGKWVPFTQ